MLKYECQRCYFKTNLHGDLQRHLSRINPCKDLRDSKMSIDDIKKDIEASKKVQMTCKTCGIAFVNKQHKYYHLQHSKCAKSRPMPITNISNNTIVINNNHIPPVSNVEPSTESNSRNKNAGWLYAITCPVYLLKGYVKLGKTRIGDDRDAAIKSLKSRYVTTFIEPEVLAVMRTNDCDESERSLFYKLDAYRLTSNREIFVFPQECIGQINSLTLSTIVIAMETACN